MSAESDSARAARVAASAHLCVCAHVQASPYWRASEPGTPCARIAAGEQHHEWCPLRASGRAPVRFAGDFRKPRR